MIKADKDNEKALPIREIVELDGEVEISRDGAYLVIEMAVNVMS